MQLQLILKLKAEIAGDAPIALHSRELGGGQARPYGPETAGGALQVSVGTRQDDSACALDVTSTTTPFGSRYLRSDSGPPPTLRI